VAKEDKNAKILKNPSGTKITILDVTDERLDIPNLDKVVQTEVQRLQRELIEDMKEVVLADIKFDSIDYIPESDVEAEGPEIKYFRDEFNKIIKIITTALDYGNTKTPNKMNIGKYLELFNVTYANNGEPKVTFRLNIDNVDGSSLSQNFAKINKRSTREKNV